MVRGGGEGLKSKRHLSPEPKRTFALIKDSKDMFKLEMTCTNEPNTLRAGICVKEINGINLDFILH